MGETCAMRFLLVLLVLVASASANVIVYKGSARNSLNAATEFNKFTRLYLVVDLSSGTGYIILYFKKDGIKDSSVLPQFDHTRYNGEAITADKRIGTFTSAIYNDIGGGEFGATMLYLRGRETSLTLGTNGIPTIGNFPKTLSGIIREAQFVAATPTNFEFNLTLTFDSLHTLAANNGFKTGLTTLNDISNELTALGY
jgi:hypothetical protein